MFGEAGGPPSLGDSERPLSDGEIKERMRRIKPRRIAFSGKTPKATTWEIDGWPPLLISDLGPSNPDDTALINAVYPPEPNDLARQSKFTKWFNAGGATLVNLLTEAKRQGTIAHGENYFLTFRPASDDPTSMYAMYGFFDEHPGAYSRGQILQTFCYELENADAEFLHQVTRTDANWFHRFPMYNSKSNIFKHRSAPSSEPGIPGIESRHVFDINYGKMRPVIQGLNVPGTHVRLAFNGISTPSHQYFPDVWKQAATQLVYPSST